MAEKMSDLSVIVRWLKSVRFIHVLIFVAVVGTLAGLNYLKGFGFSSIDRSDYKAVAENFIRDNPTIAQKLGKVQSVKLLGAGGSSGKESYNAFNIKGQDKTGMCHVTLARDEEDLWFVKSAVLMTGGSEYDIPVMRKDEKRTIKLFDR